MDGRGSNRIILSSSLQETELFGQSFARDLVANQVIALHGQLGAGKTSLAASIIETLTKSPRREISSPTFTYLQTYEGRLPLFHFDLYRIAGEEQFLQMGFDEYFQQGGVCLIEWPEKIASLLPTNTLHLHLSHEGETKRKIHVQSS